MATPPDPTSSPRPVDDKPRAAPAAGEADGVTGSGPEGADAEGDEGGEVVLVTDGRGGVDGRERAEGTFVPASGGSPARKHERRARPKPAYKPSFFERVEAFVSKLSTRNNFWHRVCSLIWLPYAFKSGIKMARQRDDTFTCILPFRRFNRNWYNAMAGAALLANSEVAGGMYIFKKAGKDYTVVCKELHYRFLRPCFGPAVYKVVPNSQLDELIASGGEFNVEITLNVFQPPAKPSEREKRVGRCRATFHVTPKQHHRDRKKAGRATAVKGMSG